MFEPITTDRLIVRAMRPDEGGLLWKRRNHPDVAEYQNWTLPFSRDRADRMVSEVCAMGGPQKDEWWMAAVEHRSTGRVVGDLSVHLDEEGRVAEIGYTFDRDQWGNGYAVESTAALIDYLFDVVGIGRVFGMLHPDNPASAQVLERCGLLFEGHTRSSFSLDGEVSDDWIYGMVRDDWEAWRDRTRTPPTDVRLVEISRDNLRDVFDLRTHRSQERFVDPMSASLADALVPEVENGHPLTPWYRAVEADGEVVGFVMLALKTEYFPATYLWRLLIDRMHQRRGIGTRVLDLIEDRVRSLGETILETSYGEGRGSPGDFYLSRGFAPTGATIDHEIELRKAL